MTTQPLDTRGRLYAQAAQFSAELEALETVRVNQMLGAWTDAYWGVRQEMDTFLAKVAAAKAAGQPVSPAWAYQQQRLKNVLDAAKAQMALYAAHASSEVVAAQQAAIDAGVAHAEALARTAVADGLPGLAVDMARINPATLRAGVGFLADGTVLANHLAATMPADAAAAVRDALIRGLAMGRSQDWMVREATKALGLTHGRATTILRTESLRAYRQASRAEYLANADVLGGWVWDAHLDARTCLACALMHGTEHPLDSTLDGHPRCRCAMVPRTRTWEELGAGPGLPDTRPPVRPGKAWLEAQTPEVQRAMMGRAKYDAWTDGAITLDDMVARSYSPAWGTMRTERSLRAIREGRDANWMDKDTVTRSRPEASEDSIWAEMIAKEEARAASRPRNNWDAWEDGRGVRVRKATGNESDLARTNLERSRRYADEDAESLAVWEQRVKDRQTELRGYVPDAKERAKVARADFTLKNAKEQVAYFKTQAAKSANELREAEARLEAMVENLPDFDPDNPLKFYGDRVTIYDRSDSTAKHLRELSEDVGETHHRLLRDHYAASEGGGFYIGDRYITDLDDLGYLKGQQPRGWTAGSTFDQVPGVYDPSRRVCACGGDSKGHGSTSLILHEGGHALDDAYGTQTVGGALTPASTRSDYLEAVDAVPSDVRRLWNPYYRPDGNPAGHNSERWAEGFAAWTKARRGTLEEQARALAAALTNNRSPDQNVVEAHMGLARYYQSLT